MRVSANPDGKVAAGAALLSQVAIRRTKMLSQ
jgi:hypothetical protein